MTQSYLTHDQFSFGCSIKGGKNEVIYYLNKKKITRTIKCVVMSALEQSQLEIIS